jgi:hypothetical protein
MPNWITRIACLQHGGTVECPVTYAFTKMPWELARGRSVPSYLFIYIFQKTINRSNPGEKVTWFPRLWTPLSMPSNDWNGHACFLALKGSKKRKCVARPKASGGRHESSPGLYQNSQGTLLPVPSSKLPSTTSTMSSVLLCSVFLVILVQLVVCFFLVTLTQSEKVLRYLPFPRFSSVSSTHPVAPPWP